MHAEPLLDLATIASQPQLWPAEIVLVTPVEFPIFVNGKQAGSAELPRGTSVTLRRVNADGTLEVQRQGATARIPARSTNLLRLLQGGSAGQAATANTSKPVAQTAARPAATPSGPRQMLEVSVSPDPTADVDIDSQGNRLKSYRIRIVNATEQNYPKVLVRFFAFARNATDEVTLAANDEQVCNVGPNTELIVLPAKLRILKGRGIDGTAVLLRDGDNNIIGSQTTRDSVTKNWPALESLPPGSPVP